MTATERSCIAFGFSGYPLRLMVSSGFILSGLAFLILLRAFYLYFIADKPLLGYTSIFAGQMLFFGIILFCLGIIGEYISRIFDEVKRRPHYVVADLAGWAKSAAQRPGAG